MQTEVITFGCRLNAFESEVMRAHAQKAGLEDTIIVNSCAVTAEAVRQARQSIRRLRRERPHAHIIVTGCAAQIEPERFAAMPEVNRVLGNEEKLRPESYLDTAAQARVRVNDIMEVREIAPHLVTSFEGQTRAFVQVQNGCNHRCTFCVIPFGRGNSRSVPVAEVVTQVRLLVEQGFREIVFTGVDISAYGEDLPGRPTLGMLVKRVLSAVPELPRLRLSSIDAAEVDDTLCNLMATEARLMPHLHLSVQAGDDMILKRMKRRHLRGDIIAFAEKMRRIRPDIVFGADLIAGFPTETEAMFEQSLALIEEAHLTWLHVFPYSARQGTPAAKMPQVPPALRKERAARLREAGRQQEIRFLQSRIGKASHVLAEQDGMGRSEHFAPVRLSAHAKPGSLHSIMPIRVENGVLCGN